MKRQNNVDRYATLFSQSLHSHYTLPLSVTAVLKNKKIVIKTNLSIFCFLVVLGLILNTWKVNNIPINAKVHKPNILESLASLV
jgi:hypothetical protein